MHQIFLLLLAALAVAGAGIYIPFVLALKNARTRLAGRSQTIETTFGTLEYAELGEGQSVLVVHGAGGGFDQGLDMTGAMAQRGFRLIAVSRFGYLRSAFPEHLTTAMQADAYAELLEHLGISKAIVAGTSAGAWSAVQFAIRHPERSRALVLLVPADYLPEGIAIHGGIVAKAIFGSDFAAWAAVKLAEIVPGALSQTLVGTDAAVLRAAEPAEKVRVRQVLEHLLPVSRRFEGMQFDIQTAAAREPYPIEKIACPVLTISAEDDRFGTALRAKQIAAGVPGGKAILFATGGHALVGHFSDALRAVTSFLEAL